MRVLFILKRNLNYNFVSYTRRSSGLWNSTRFITEAMVARGLKVDIVEVFDNNCIDREISRFKPDIVILEALWCVPSKIIELKKIHKKVKWYCHLHSHIPFLALEGIAMEWIDDYGALGVGIIANSEPSYKALKMFDRHKKLIYLPNVYLATMLKPVSEHLGTDINIGCFGAVRPLKNQLIQAMAAIQYAKEIGKKLRFHMNGTRVEQMGQPVQKNIAELFARTKDVQLILHAWHEPEEFIRQLHMKMNMALQVSLTETFCIVAADCVAAGIPLVTSKEVYWISDFSKAKDDSIDDIVKHMHWAHSNRMLVEWNQHLLQKQSNIAQEAWYDFLKDS